MFPRELVTLTRAAAAAALTAVLAQVAVPLPFTPVPVTLQVLGVLLAAVVLPPPAAALSQAIYLALGAAGVPVFAGFSGGAGRLAGPTGGYLWGFALAAPAASFLYRALGRPRGRLSPTAAAASACALGVALIYAAGVAQLALVLGVGWRRALLLGAVPFLPVDLGKAALAAVAGPYVERALTAAAGVRAPSPPASGRPA